MYLSLCTCKRSLCDAQIGCQILCSYTLNEDRLARQNKTVFIHSRPVIIIQQITFLLFIFLLHHRFYDSVPSGYLTKEIMIVRVAYSIDYAIFYSPNTPSGFFLRDKLRKRGDKFIFKLEAGYIFLSFFVGSVCFYSAISDKPNITAGFILTNKKITFL